VLLNWRAFYRTKGTEHAVSSIRTQQRLAIDAFVEKLAGIGPHGFHASQYHSAGKSATNQEQRYSFADHFFVSAEGNAASLN
jgi:hypothetical protein